MSEPVEIAPTSAYARVIEPIIQGRTVMVTVGTRVKITDGRDLYGNGRVEIYHDYSRWRVSLSKLTVEAQS